MPLPNNDYAMRRSGYQNRVNTTSGGGAAVAGGISCFGIVLIWLVLKVIPVWILIVNIIAVIHAAQINALNTFDFTWLVISAILTIVL